MNSKLIAAFAVLAVTMAGICGVAMFSEDSEAVSDVHFVSTSNPNYVDQGTSSNPLTDLTLGITASSGSSLAALKISSYLDGIYVFVGSPVSLDVNPSQPVIVGAVSVTSGFGLSISTGTLDSWSSSNSQWSDAGSVEGTFSKAGDCTISYLQGSPSTPTSYSVTIHVVEAEEEIDFTSPKSVEAISGASVSYTADTNIDATFSKSGGTASTLSVSSTGKVTGNLPTVTSVTDYTLVIKATSKTNSSNTVTQTITFTVYPILKISPSSSTTISGTEDEAITAVQLSANLDATFSKSSGTWPSGISMSSSGKISGTPTAASTASVTVKATAAEGPSQTATKMIKFDIEAAEASLTLTVGTPASSYIAGGSVSISVSANVSGTTFKITGDGSSFLTVSGGKITGSIPTTYEEQTIVSFKVTGTSPGGQTASKDLVLAIEPKIEFTTIPTVSCVINPVYDYDDDGQPVLSSLIPSVLAADPESYTFPDTLTIEAVFTGENAETVTWDWGDGSEVSTGNKAQHTYAETGTYTIVLTATNDVGSDTLEITVTVGESGFDYVYWIIIAVLAIVAIYLIYRLAAGPSRRRS